MDRRKLVAAVAQKTDYAKWEIDKILPLVCESILEALQNGEKVSISNFGTFDLKEKKEMIYFNPQTKQRRILPAKMQVVFHITPKFRMDKETTNKLINENDETK